MLFDLDIDPSKDSFVPNATVEAPSSFGTYDALSPLLSREVNFRFIVVLTCGIVCPGRSAELVGSGKET